MPGSPRSYAKHLSERRDALARFSHMTDTVPQLDERALEEEKNMVARRKPMLESISNATMDPADGRWIFLAQRCRLHATRGGSRWMGTNVDRQALPQAAVGRRLRSKAKKVVADPPDPGRKSEDDLLRQKVESWKRTIDAIGTAPEAGDLHPPSASRQRRGAEESTRLNFKVVKRTAQTNVPKSSTSKFTPSSPPRPSGEQLHPEPSFLPPSFPSHLPTSTPQHPDRQKPPPIPCTSVASPLISLENNSVLNGILDLDRGGCHTPSPSHNATASTLAQRPSSVERSVNGQSSGLNGHSIRRSSSHAPSPNNDSKLKPQTHQSGLLEDDAELDFDPPFASTQKAVAITGHPTPTTDRDTHWRGYNSQFDVDRGAVEAANLLGQDVDIEGWYRESE